MALIRVLEDHIASKIAAGEVIERPASIVKELVENAIDAQSTSITVEIKNGGIPYIRVSDNGCGMSREDAELCFARHATSKISSVMDLNAIATLGFRGEALYSIAAISNVELTTRRKESESGTRIIIKGGVIESVQEVGCPEGTTIIIQNMFYNTPARLKFLKKVGIEAGYVGDVLLRQILARPDISFRYVNNNKTLYFTSGNGDLFDCIYTVYGKEQSAYLHRIDYRAENISIGGFIGMPEIARSNRMQQSVYINGRYIKSPLISASVSEAYDTKIMINKFPFFVLKLEMDPRELDVNVHPNKLEVRFADELRVRRNIVEAVKAALLRPAYRKGALSESKREEAPKADIPFKTANPCTADGERVPREQAVQLGIQVAKSIPEPKKQEAKEPTIKRYSDGGITLEMIEPFLLPRTKESEEAPAFILKEENSLMSGTAIVQQKPAVLESKPTAITAEILKTEREANVFEMLTVIGQLFATYILAQKGDKFYIIDQHAAHERLIYEDFLKQLENGREVFSQPLLVPLVVELTPLEKESVRGAISLFTDIGFVLEEFGPLSYLIRAVPCILGAPQAESFFREYLDHIDEYMGREAVAKRKEKLIMLSCKKAVKGGDKLGEKEIGALIRKMEAGEIPLTCPHGRPVVTSMTKQEIEKAFGRRV